MAKAKKTRTRTAEQKAARKRADQARAASGGIDQPVTGEPAKLPKTVTNAPPNEAENQAEQSAAAANEVARRRHEQGAPDPEGDGPEVGRVDNRPETSFETQQMPRPARPLTPVNAVADRFAPVATPDDEDPLLVDRAGGFPKKVRAISMGYYRHSRRRAGDVFLIYNPREFSPKWMEYAGSNDVEKITTGQQELERQRRASLEDQLAKKRAGTGDANVLGA